MKRLILTTLPLSLALLLAVPVCADVVELKGGGQIEGQVLRDAELPRSVMAVASPWGRIVIDRREVKKLKTEDPNLSEYRRRAPAISDTAEAQLAFAMWCRNQGLGEELRIHLRRVLELDPENEKARSMLGYQRIDGKWMTRDDLLASRGLIRYEGDFRTQQEIALLESQRQFEEADIEWRKQLVRWRKQLESSNREAANEAAEWFASLKDPTCANQLIRLLDREEDLSAKLMMIQILGRLRTNGALQVLASMAINEEDGEVRAVCLEQLSRANRNGITTPFIAALESSDNVIVNRGGEALRVLGDEPALKPLVEALITTHKYQIGNDSGGDTYSANLGTGQHSFGGGGPKIIKKDLRNPSVLNALTQLTGVNYLYDQEQWRDWLASRQIIADVDLRRDP